MEVLGAWHGNTEEGDAELRNTAPALQDNIYFVAGPWQPGRGQDQCLGDAGADALVLDAPTITPVRAGSNSAHSPSPWLQCTQNHKRYRHQAVKKIMQGLFMSCVCGSAPHPTLGSQKHNNRL